MKKVVDRKKVIVFCKGFKYEGVFIDEDDATYTIIDMVDGVVRLPKANSVLKEVK